MDGVDEPVDAVEFTVITRLDPAAVRRAGRRAAAGVGAPVVETSVGAEGIIYLVRAQVPSRARVVLVLHWTPRDDGTLRVSLAVEDIVNPVARTSTVPVGSASAMTPTREFAAELYRELTAP